VRSLTWARAADRGSIMTAAAVQSILVTERME